MAEDLLPWEKPYDPDPRRLRADDVLATMGQRIERLAGALNALHAARAAGDLPGALCSAADDSLRAASAHLAAVQRIDSTQYMLEFETDDDDERRAVLRDQLADMAERWPHLADRCATY